MATVVIRDVLHTYDWTGQGRSPTVEEEVPTLVFVHGWLLSRAYWKPVIEQLSQFYPCLNYDLRGFGESDATRQADQSYPEQGFTLEDYATDLQFLLAELGIKKAWVVGHSLGGSIALWTASQLKDVVQGVVCVNSGGGIYIKEEFEKFRTAGQKLVKNRWPWLLYLPFIDVPFTRLMVHQTLARRWGKQRIQDFFVADDKAALGALLETTTEEEVHHLPQLVAKLEQPVHFPQPVGLSPPIHLQQSYAPEHTLARCGRADQPLPPLLQDRRRQRPSCQAQPVIARPRRRNARGCPAVLCPHERQ